MEKFLVLYEESKKKEIFFFAEMPITIGRSLENSIVIDDAFLSDVHARIEKRKDGGCRVVDLSSGRGIRVNGEQVEGEVDIRKGDAIGFGAIQVVYGNSGPVSSAAVDEDEMTTDVVEKTGEGLKDGGTAVGASSRARSAMKKAVNLFRKGPSHAREKAGASDAGDGSKAEVEVKKSSQTGGSGELEKAAGRPESDQKPDLLKESSIWQKQSGAAGKAVTWGEGDSKSPDFQRRRIFPERAQPQQAPVEMQVSSEDNASSLLQVEGRREALSSRLGEPTGDSSGQETAGQPVDEEQSDHSNRSPGRSPGNDGMEDVSPEAKDTSGTTRWEEMKRELADVANSNGKLFGEDEEDKATLMEEVALLEEQRDGLRKERRSLEKEVAKERAQLALVGNEISRRVAEIEEMDRILGEKKREIAVVAARTEEQAGESVQ